MSTTDSLALLHEKIDKLSPSRDKVRFVIVNVENTFAVSAAEKIMSKKKHGAVIRLTRKEIEAIKDPAQITWMLED